MKKILHLLKFVFVLLLIQNCLVAYADLGDGNELSVDFTLIVGRYNATTKVFTPLAPDETVLQNELIAVRIVPTSDYLVGASNYVIMFDQTLFTIQGANKAAFIVNTDAANIIYDEINNNFTTLPGYSGNHYYDFACTGYSGATTIPDASWPASFAEGEKYDVYKAIKVGTQADSQSRNEGYPEVLPGDWLFQFRLMANANIVVGTDARIWMDARWFRSNSNPGVDGYIPKCLTGDLASNAKTTYDFDFDFSGADIKLALTGTTTTITFDTDGGNAIAPITQDEGTAITAPANPTRAGFTFQGWVPAVPATMPVDDMTCVAQWEAIPNPTSTITFNTDGGNAIAPITQDEGTAVTAPADPTRAGFTFQGWIPAVPATMPVDDLTCVAQWEAIPNPTSTITFDTDGGNVIAPVTQDEGTPVTAPADPTKAGFTFQGWVPEVPATMPVDDMTCVAQWSINTYEITFDAAGGEGGEVQYVDYGATPIPPTVTRAGYTFNGWSPTVVAATANATYTAQWQQSTRTITFDAAGGTPVAPITQVVGTPVTPPANPTRAGYTFNGWVPEVPATMPAENITCVAQWEAIPNCIPGEIWTARTATQAYEWTSVTYGNGLFVAVAKVETGETNSVMTSPDGINWTERTAASAHWWYSVTYGNGLFVAVAVTGSVMTSPDGITWTTRSVAGESYWTSVTYNSGLFVAVATGGTNRVMTSPDGITWTIGTAPNANWNSVTYGNDLFVAVASSGTNRVMTSPDGITWTARTAAEANEWYSVTYANELFVAVGISGTNRVMTSPDGITWTARTAAEANYWFSVTYGDGLFVAVAGNGINRVMTSPDGITWTIRTATESSTWYSVTYGNSSFVAVAYSGTNQVMTSECTGSNPTSTISFNVDGGSPIASITQDEGTPVTAPADPTKAGYTFEGWVPALPATMPVDDMTCVAQWEAITNPTSTITFNVDGGSPIATITQDEGAEVTAPADPTKAGYTFEGWVPAVPATMPEDDMTCVAQWEAITNPTSTITFDVAGGSAIAPITQDEGTAVTPPADPTKAGYTFEGWVPAVPATMPVDDLTCVAQWEEIVNIGPTLLAKIPDQSQVCEDQDVSATFNAGSGGSSACCDEYQYSFNGSTWYAYTPGNNINTLAQGGNIVSIQGRRGNCSGQSGCNPTLWETLASWTVEPTPVSGTIAKTPNVISVCEGMDVSAVLTSGSGGNGSDSLSYRTYDGTNWSAWVDYSSASPISTLELGVVEIQTLRLADYCSYSAANTVSWSIHPKPVAFGGDDATITEGEDYTLLDASAENYTSVSWTTDGDGSFSSTSSLTPVYTPGDADVAAGAVELCLTAAAEIPCTVNSTDCMILTIQRHPTVSITSTADGSSVYTNLVTISGIAADADGNLSLVEVKLNTGTWQIATSTDTWTIDLTFEPGKNTLLTRAKDASGLYSDTATINVLLSVQIINIPKGWSAISSYLTPINPDLPTMMDEITSTSNLVIMLSEYGIYWPPYNTNTIGNWNVEKGYKVKMNSAQEFTVRGDTVSTRSLSLSQGYHIIPVLSNVGCPINEVFTDPLNDIFFMYDVKTNALFWPQGEIFSLTTLEPGKGYIASFNNAVTLTYPAYSGLKTGVISDNTEPEMNGPWALVRTGDVHFISIKNEALNKLESSDFIGAFDSFGNCIGFAEVDGRGDNYLLSVYGNDAFTDVKDGAEEAEPISFRSYNSSTNIETELVAEFNTSFPNADGLYVSGGQSGIINFKESSTGIGGAGSVVSVDIYPNPAKDVVNIITKGFQTLEGFGTLMTAEGKLVKTFVLTGNQTQLDVQDLQPGIYMLRIETDENLVVKRLVIQ